MSATIPTIEPRRVVAGDSLRWRLSLTDYPAGDGWTLHYQAFNALESFDIVASPDGDAHLVDVPPAASAAYVPGDYTLAARVERNAGEVNAERFSLHRVSLQVLSDATGALDARTPARRIVEALVALYEQHVTSGRALTQAYTIESRSFTFIDAADLLKQIAFWQQQAQQQDTAAGLLKRRRVLTRFAR